MFDALVLGSGPAGLLIAAELCDRGLKVAGLAPEPPTTAWPNTYGIWVDELEGLGLTDLLEHRWQNSVAYFGPEVLPLRREYGVFSKAKFQQALLDRARTTTWHRGKATGIEHRPQGSNLQLADGTHLDARVVIDTSGHIPILVKRPPKQNIAYQAAYGIVGRFSAPPVEPGQFVLMDYRAEHLSPEERRQQPPTFSYEMDFGEGIYFVEETSLAHAPAMAFEVLEKRLQRRLAARGIEVSEVQHVERCLFPMNVPLPDLTQAVVGFGGAASMVHPASGYMVGGLLRRGPGLATAIAQALQDPKASPQVVAQAGWQALWDRDRLRKHYLYLFGLEALMGFEETRLNHHFETFFTMPQAHWSQFLADTLSTPELIQAMLGMFGRAPNDVRWGLMRSVGRQGQLLGAALRS
ncbi:MAG: lycopene cyclase family protein [Synechococcales cyanobacterium RU_4_20]|nr:lycopene cyclase family protein [Synechococcales cyanobacterium RU_4_20]